MAGVCCLQQHVVKASAGAQVGIVWDANVLGNPVRRREADAVDVPGQRVRVGLNSVNSLLPVSLVDADGPAGADSVRGEEHHDFANPLLLRPSPFDPVPALGPDALHLLQAGGVVFDDVEDLLSELVHELPGLNWPAAL